MLSFYLNIVHSAQHMLITITRKEKIFLRRSRTFLAFFVFYIDYAGPIDIKAGGRGNKSYKGYIAVFVCMATKAIHLEAVQDMTSDKFRNALSR